MLHSVYYNVLPDIVLLCLYSAVTVKRTDINVNFVVHKSVVMVSVNPEPFLDFHFSFLKCIPLNKHPDYIY